jgi:hypothetical protein
VMSSKRLVLTGIVASQPDSGAIITSFRLAFGRERRECPRRQWKGLISSLVRRPLPARGGTPIWASAIAVFLVCRYVSLSAWPSPGLLSVRPEDDLQMLVSTNPPGTTFLIRAGVHRLQSAVPRSGDSFIGEQGAVLSGAMQLTSFRQQDVYWTGQAPARMSESEDRQSAALAKCLPAHPACGLPEDLFVDNTPLERVSDLAAVFSGKWYLDYSSGTVYLADDPRGRLVEMSIARHAFSGSAANVTIRGLVIEKYANPDQTGAINALGDPGPCGHLWVIEKNEVRLNHGGGVKLCDAQMTGNYVHGNGQIGVIGVGDNEVVQLNEIAANNYAGYDYRWEAGGARFAGVHNLVVRSNDVHDNGGPGLRTDSGSMKVLYEHNRTRHNLVAGISHEVSFDAVIRNNTIENDGYDPQHSSPWYGAGIEILGSPNVDIYGNTITNCMNGIIAKQPEGGPSRDARSHLVKNLYVHNNNITQARGIALGVLKDGSSDDSIFTSSHNRFVNNTLKLEEPNGKYFVWQNAQRSLREWKSLWEGSEAGYSRARRRLISPRHRTG